MLNPQLDRRGELIHLLSTEGLPRRHAERLLETAAAAAEPSWPTQAMARCRRCSCSCPTRVAPRARPTGAPPNNCCCRSRRWIQPSRWPRPWPPAARHPGAGHPASGAALWAATHWAAAHAPGRRRGRQSFRNSLFGGGFDHAAAPRLRVLNAGDGVHADPLAALALLRAILCAKPDLTRLAVTLVGDVRHSGLAAPDPRAHHIGRARAARGRAAVAAARACRSSACSRSARWTRAARCRCHHPAAAERRGRRRRATAVAARLRRRLSAQPRALALARSDALLLSAAGLHAGIEAEVAFDAALARAGHERDALEHALRLAALRLLSDSLGRTLAQGRA